MPLVSRVKAGYAVGNANNSLDTSILLPPHLRRVTTARGLSKIRPTQIPCYPRPEILGLEARFLFT